MSDESARRVAVALASEVTRRRVTRLCSVCVDLVGVAGAGITILGGDRVGPICVSNDRMALLEEFQFTAGEGPCREAFASGEFVHTRGSTTSRWHGGRRSSTLLRRAGSARCSRIRWQTRGAGWVC